MKTADEKLNTFTLDLRNHSPEGVDILASEPSRLISATIYLLLALLLTALAWSFIGKSDVIVTTQGAVIPDSKIQRVYAPLDGELIDIYITEGMPVKKGDILARIHATQAIQFTEAYLNAKLTLVEKEKEFKRWPVKKKLMEQKVEALKKKYQTEDEIFKKRADTTLERLAEEHKLALRKQRTELSKNQLELSQARNDKEKFERLYSKPGHGGISKARLTQKQIAYKNSLVNYELTKNRFNDLEIKFIKEFNTAKETQLQDELKLVDLRLAYENEGQAILQEEVKINKEFNAARIQVESAAKVSPENIDEEGFLKILSPFSGIITQVPYDQLGDKIQAKTPLASIAPKDSKIVLEIEIPEFNRGLLREGMPVKLKVSAFAYQRYGFLNGALEYLAPTTKVSNSSKKPFYKGLVRLDKTYFMSDGYKYPLRYGMTATAEIVVRQRRIIDFVLDPIRGLTS